MTTLTLQQSTIRCGVVEAYRLDRYDNPSFSFSSTFVVEVVEAYRLDRYDNLTRKNDACTCAGCRSLSFG